MTEYQLKIADKIVLDLSKVFPDQTNLHWKSDEYERAKIVLAILIDENWIFESGSGYKLNSRIISVLEKYNSYSEFDKHYQRNILRQEQKVIFDFHVSKWKYHTFWFFFALAIFGGGYSTYDLISNLTKPKSNQSKQNPIKEKESAESKSHTLILNQKNPDSLHNAKILNDTLINK